MPENRTEALVSTAISLAVSLLLAVVFVCFASDDPLDSVSVFLAEPFADFYTVCRIFTESIPLMFTGAAVCIMTSAGQFNMFVEGGFFLGAFIAAVLSPEIATESSGVLVPCMCIFAGAAASGVVGYVPAKLKSRLGVDEFVCSLMLNYIVLWVVLFLVNNVLGDPDMTNVTKYLEDNAKLPFISQDNELSIGFLIAVGVSILSAVFLFKSKWGFSIRLCGANQRFSNYCGIRTDRVVVYSQVIGAVIAGLGGGVYMLGNYYRFAWRSLPNYGFDGFVIAIIARNNPWFVPFASLFLAYIRVGAQQMALYTDVQNEIVYILQGVMIIVFGARLLASRLRKVSKKTAGGGR